MVNFCFVIKISWFRSDCMCATRKPGPLNLNSGVEINFSNNLPVGQVIANVCLPEEISTCPTKMGTISFEAMYTFGKKIVKFTSRQKH